MKLTRKISYSGLVLSFLYLLVAITILVLSWDCRGEGCVLQLFVTFPWFFLFLDSSSTALTNIVSLTLNAVIWYLLGLLIGKLAKRISSQFTGRG